MWRHGGGLGRRGERKSKKIERGMIMKERTDGEDA